MVWRAKEICHHGFGNRGNRAASRDTVESASDVVGKHRRAIAADAHKIGVSAVGKFRSNAPAAIVFIQIEVHTLLII